MTWEIVFRKVARKEFDKAYDWYESQKENLGDDFAACVQEQIDVLKLNPKVHAKIYKEARRAVARRFPYVIYYSIHGNRVQIESIFLASRNPVRWQKRFD
jgi:plasmid stabilization system protein ParE